MTTVKLKLDFDPTASLQQNQIVRETGEIKQNIVTLQYGSFYAKDLIVELSDNQGDDAIVLDRSEYELVDYQQEISSITGFEAYAVILLKDTHQKTNYSITYRACGGIDEPIPVDKLMAIWEQLKLNRGNIDWSQVLAPPKEFNPAPHYTPADTIYGFDLIIEGLNRFRLAIKDGKDPRQSNFEIIQVMMNAGLTYYNNYNRLYAEEKSKIDRDIALSEKTVEDVKDIYNQILSNDFYLQSASIFESLRYKVRKLYMDSVDALYMSTFCSLLGLRDKKGLVIDDPSLDIYKKIGDLQVYYRTDRSDGLTVVPTGAILTDYSGNGVAGITVTAQAPTLVTSAMMGQKVIKTANGKKFTFSSKKPTINKNSSMVLMLCTDGTSSNFIKLTLLKNSTYELKIDTQNERALSLIKISTGEKVLDIKCSRFISDSRMLIAFSLNDYPQLSYALSSHPKDSIDENNGFTSVPRVTDSIGFDEMLVGTTENAGGFMSMAIFNKTLSKRHLEAISFYWTIMSDVSVNFAGNSYFFDKDYDCTSDYLKVDSITATEQNLFSNDALDVFFKLDSALGDTVAKTEFSGKTYMLSRGSTRPNKVVLRKKSKVDIGQTYCLFFDLAFSEINPPIIRLKINGEEVLERFTRRDNSLSKNCMIEFRLEDKEEITIEWLNDQLQVSGNLFAITNIRLLAKPNIAVTVF